MDFHLEPWLCEQRGAHVVAQREFSTIAFASMLYIWQALDLLACIAWHTCAALLSLPLLLLRVALGHSLDSEQQDACTYYEGMVTHVRRAPVENKFRCAVASVMCLQECEQQLLW